MSTDRERIEKLATAIQTTTTAEASMALVAAFLRECAAAPTPPAKPLPPPELTWLYTHCKAIGMTCKSDSGKWEHDIALFTIHLREALAELVASGTQAESDAD